MSLTYPISEETGEILWITAPFYSKQRQRTLRPCSIAPIKDLYFLKVKKDMLLLSSLTLPTLKRKIKLSSITWLTLVLHNKVNIHFKIKTPTEPQAANIKVLDVLNTSKEWEFVTVQGKILGFKDQHIVGSPSKKLRLMEAFLNDGSGRTPIDIWESHIENVKTCRYW